MNEKRLTKKLLATIPTFSNVDKRSDVYYPFAVLNERFFFRNQFMREIHSQKVTVKKLKKKLFKGYEITNKMANSKTVRTTKKSTKKVVKTPAVQKETVVPVVEPPKEETPVPVVEIPVEPTSDNLETSEVVNNLDNTDSPNNVLSENDNAVSDNNENLVEKKAKLKPDKDSLIKKWNECFEIYADVLKARKQPHQNQSLYNYLRSLKNDTMKVIRVKNKGNVTDANKNQTSGFLKPVNVSDDLRKFINPLFLDDQEKEKPITRVLITQKLCQYIKEKNLQKPEDKREILPDDSLKKLFNIQPDEKEKLTYYSMQKRIQSHIFKI